MSQTNRIADIISRSLMKIFDKPIQIVVLLAVAVASFLLAKSIYEPEPTEVAPPPALDVSVIRQRLDKISELATVSYSYTDVALHKKSEKLWGFDVPFSTSSLLVRYDGVIKAGVVLSDATVAVADTTVTIALPAPRVLSHSVDPSSIKVLDQSNGIFSSVKMTDYIAFCSAHKDSIQAVALASGLLDSAASAAADGLEIIAAPLRDMGYRVIITSQPADSLPAAPDSLSPDACVPTIKEAD